MGDALKGALASKTIWFNAALAILGIIDTVQAHSGIIAALLPSTGPLLVALGAAGAALRFLTSKSLAEKGDPDATLH